MKKIYLFSCCFIFLLTAFCFTPVQGQQLAFPGAEGFGRYTSGGRGGVVYEVTNLNSSGEGSFRAGVEMSGARTIVFRVSGTIHLESDLRIRNGDLTIAGQTAPGDGIAIKGGSVVLDADNVIIRYMRFRPGDISGRELDALWGRENKDIIIDHCSMSWSTDEVSSFYDNENFTMQWCILSESLYESVHGKGKHGYGGIWGGKNGASFHHNLLAHHYSRNPRFNGARYTTTPETELVDFRNNVIYNWGGNSAYGGEEGRHNIVANYYKAGPATPSGEKSYRILDASAPSIDELGRWYVAGNYVEGFADVTADNWLGVQRLTEEEEAIARVEEPFAFAPVTTQHPLDALASVLDHGGASFPQRDPIDARIAAEVEKGTATYGGAYGAAKGIIDSQETVGGWPDLISAPAPEDADHDGMPDAWEVAKGLDPNNAADGNEDMNSDGYTNLEEYLNSLLETEPADFLRHPSSLMAVEVTTSSILLNWVDNADRETEIIVERSRDNETFTELARLGSNATSYLDEALAPGEVYYYRLQAVNESEASAYSPPLAVMTRNIPTAPDQEKLAAYWNFGEGSDGLVEDMSVHENDGELLQGEGVEWVAGKLNTAIDFSGAEASTHILVPHAEVLDYGYTSFAVSFWMKATQTVEPAYVFHKGSFTKSIGAGTSGKWYGLELKDGIIRFAVDDNNTKSEVSASSEAFLSGGWVHVVAVRNTREDALTLYLNGESVEQGIDLTSGTISQEEPLILGNSAELNTPFTGLLDEVKFYGYALDEAEVAGIYAGIPMQTFNPSPAQAEVNVNPGELQVSWSGDAPSYALYMGTSAENMELVAEGITESAYTLTSVSESTEHFWRVDAIGENETITGETWSFTTGVPTGLARQEVFKRFKSFPNPFADELTLEFELLKQERVLISFYDLHNRKLLDLEEIVMGQGVHRIKLGSAQLRNLPEGVYICVLKTPEHTLVKRLMHLKK